MEREWTIDENDAGVRADVAVARAMAVSRCEAQRLIETGAVVLNDERPRPSSRLRKGDLLRISHSRPMPCHLASEPIPLDVLYEDGDLLVLNKPRGMVVHPAPGHSDGTLANAVLAHAGDIQGVGDEMRPGLVHRLDKDTSGLMVVAKNTEAYAGLQQQMHRRRIERLYTAAVWGSPSFRQATVDACVGRHPTDRKRMAVLPEGSSGARKAVTHLSVIERLGPFSLLEARLETGRTHQIRVHCLYIGHPVVGDPVYGGRRRLADADAPRDSAALLTRRIDALQGQALHAFRLAFHHPRTGERLSFEAPSPEQLSSLIELMRETYA